MNDKRLESSEAAPIGAFDGEAAEVTLGEHELLGVRLAEELLPHFDGRPARQAHFPAALAAALEALGVIVLHLWPFAFRHEALHERHAGARDRLLA